MWVKRVAFFALAAAARLLAAGVADAQAAPGGGQVVIPQSSVEKPGDIGKRAHTNIEIFVPNPGTGLPPPAPPSPGVGPRQTAPRARNPGRNPGARAAVEAHPARPDRDRKAGGSPCLT